MNGAFTDYVHYLEVERGYSNYTLRNYTSALMELVRFLKYRGINSFGELDRDNFRKYLAMLSDRGLSKRSVALKITAIRSFSNFLVSEGILSSNPLDRVKSPKLDKRLPAILSVSEMKSLLNSVDLTKPTGLRDRAILEVLYSCGLRVSELVSLDLNSIDFASREVRVFGKGNKERIALFGEPTTDALTAYINESRPRFLDGNKTNALFVGRWGMRLSARRIEKVVGQCGIKANIGKRVYPHLLRHSFATHLLEGGANLRVVQELLGHESLTTTQIYTNISMSHIRKTYLATHPLAKIKGGKR